METNRPGRSDFATFAGVAVALASLVGGLLLEGGSIRDIAQLTAALIVVGGTFGAILASTPFSVLAGAGRGLRSLLFSRHLTPAHVLDEIIRLSGKSRRVGLAALETDAFETEDPFFQKALSLAVDNTPLSDIRSIMEIELDLEEVRLEAEAKVFETAGGYAPTVGIIGAVLGLIQVMKHLDSIDEVGRGIAVSFVATVYGVALANLVLLPLAAKLRARASHLILTRELMLEGVLGVAQTTNTTLLRLKLEPYALRARPQRWEQRERSTASPRPAPFAA